MNLVVKRFVLNLEIIPHNYNKDELLEIKNKITYGNPEKIYVFFNNNHAMLENARLMYNLFL